jgi:hypothetical protein
MMTPLMRALGIKDEGGVFFVNRTGRTQWSDEQLNVYLNVKIAKINPYKLNELIMEGKFDDIELTEPDIQGLQDNRMYPYLSDSAKLWLLLKS